MDKIYIKGVVTKIADDTYEVIASTNSIDRQGDSIDQSGWQLDNYMRNPVMLWAHNYDELPVAKALEVSTASGQLRATFVFASAEANPKAAQIKKLYEDGFLNATSVGFIPLTRSGNIITSAELLEISFVPVPANQDALRLAMQKGLDVSLVKKDLQIEEEPAQIPTPIEEKSGRKLSNETIKALEIIHKCIKDADTAMEALKASAIQGDGTSDDNKSAEKVGESNLIVLDSKDVEQLRKAFQVSDKQNEFILGLLKTLKLQAK